MKTIKQLANLALLLLTLTAVSCEKSYDNPEQYQPATLEANTTLAELKTLYKTGGTRVTDDLIIEGTVTSTDRYGNNYRSLFIQDETTGIELRLGKTSLYNLYPQGTRLVVKCKGLFLGAYGGMVSIGEKSADAKYESTWIDAQYWLNHVVFRTEIGEQATPDVITNKAELANPALIGKLVRIENLYFEPGVEFGDWDSEEKVETWAMPDDPKTAENESNYVHHFANFSPSDKETITIRTSGYAKFAAVKAPAAGAKFAMTGILTDFNGKKQFILNNISDVEVEP